MAALDDILVFAHIGDLHLTTEDRQNYQDLRAIVSEITAVSDFLDFVYVPGDNADNGRAEQYALAARELSRIPIPVHIVTGDHDMEQGGLDNFYGALATGILPRAIEAGGIRCLFLDLCGAGKGGPDFRIGANQSIWLMNQLAQAASEGGRCAIFMHTYPADLRGQGETSSINKAFEAREVLLVEMGHTHYNELSNDGRTIFAATRSTGQIEEGPVGYAIGTIDKRTVSWRFRALGTSGPIVLVTAPADRRLANDIFDRDHIPRENACDLRVSVIAADESVAVTYQINGGARVSMIASRRGRYGAAVVLPPHATTIIVTAIDKAGRVGCESIEIATDAWAPAPHRADGSDADAIGAWVERGILGTQLGPNRNGRGWSS